jgi:hypothetical protein
MNTFIERESEKLFSWYRKKFDLLNSKKISDTFANNKIIDTIEKNLDNIVVC